MYSQCFYAKVAITPDLQVEFRWTGKNKCGHVKISQQELQDLILMDLKSYDAEYW